MSTLNSHSSHFKLGYRGKSMSSTMSEFYKKVNSTPNPYVKHKSAVFFGTDKADLTSLSNTQYSSKGFTVENTKKPHKNQHNFALGYSEPADSNKKPQENIEQVSYQNLNKQSNLVFGTDKPTMKSITKTSYVRKHGLSHQRNHSEKNLKTSSNWYFGQEKNDFLTNSMLYQGLQVEKVPNSKIPDSEIFGKSKTFSASSTQIGKNSKTQIQEASLNRDFIYSGHFSMGSFANIGKKEELKEFSNCKDKKSLIANRSKILGSSIEFGLGNNEYKTDYSRFYVKQEVNPPRSIRNCISNVCFGIGSNEKDTEYNLKFKKAPIYYHKPEVPKNTIQNINIFKPY